MEKSFCMACSSTVACQKARPRNVTPSATKKILPHHSIRRSDWDRNRSDTLDRRTRNRLEIDHHGGPAVELMGILSGPLSSLSTSLFCKALEAVLPRCCTPHAPAIPDVVLPRELYDPHRKATRGGSVVDQCGETGGWCQHCAGGTRIQDNTANHHAGEGRGLKAAAQRLKSAGWYAQRSNRKNISREATRQALTYGHLEKPQFLQNA